MWYTSITLVAESFHRCGATWKNLISLGGRVMVPGDFMENHFSTPYNLGCGAYHAPRVGKYRDSPPSRRPNLKHQNDPLQDLWQRLKRRTVGWTSTSMRSIPCDPGIEGPAQVPMPVLTSFPGSVMEFKCGAMEDGRPWNFFQLELETKKGGKRETLMTSFVWLNPVQ